MVQDRLPCDVVDDAAVRADRHARHPGGFGENFDVAGRPGGDEGEGEAAGLGGGDGVTGAGRNGSVAAQQGAVEVARDQTKWLHRPV